MKKYERISLRGATLVGRSHAQETPMPGVRKLENFYISRSAGLPTLRPDWEAIATASNAVTTNDFLNTISYARGSGISVYFNRESVNEAGGFNGGNLVDLYEAGVASGSVGSATVTFNDTPQLLTYVWPGCRLQSGGKWYFVDSVDDDDTITLTETLDYG